MSRIDRLLKSTTPWPTDGGLETVMIFLEGIDLPHFASFALLNTEEGRAALTRYFDHFLGLARSGGTGFVLDTPTWRANMGWAAAMGMDGAAMRRANVQAAEFAKSYRAMRETEALPILVNGVVGPAGDGYSAEQALTAAAAEDVHELQIKALKDGGVDMISAITMTYPAQAIGIARAASRHGLPHVLSFTLETDGRLPNGQALHDALAETEAQTGGSAAFYMINCAHPSHFAADLAGPMRARIGGIRANASRLSHAELDESATLDDGDPVEFGYFYAAFARYLPNLKVVGGCCGSDHRHVGEVCRHLHKSRT